MSISPYQEADVHRKCAFLSDPNILLSANFKILSGKFNEMSELIRYACYDKCLDIKIIKKGLHHLLICQIRQTINDNKMTGSNVIFGEMLERLKILEFYRFST